MLGSRGPWLGEAVVQLLRDEQEWEALEPRGSRLDRAREQLDPRLQGLCAAEAKVEELGEKMRGFMNKAEEARASGMAVEEEFLLSAAQQVSREIIPWAKTCERERQGPLPPLSPRDEKWVEWGMDVAQRIAAGEKYAKEKWQELGVAVGELRKTINEPEQAVDEAEKAAQSTPAEERDSGPDLGH